MSAPVPGTGAGGAETVDPTQYGSGPTAVTAEDVLADGEDIDPPPGEMAVAAFAWGGGGGGGPVGPSLSETILAAFVAAELLRLPPRPDASLFDALIMPKNEETLMPDDDDDSALIEEDG